jgi:hypothetical protein
MKHFISAANPMRAQFNPVASYQARHFAWRYQAVDGNDEKGDRGGVGTLTLNRPERKNPLTFDSYAATSAAAATCTRSLARLPK